MPGANDLNLLGILHSTASMSALKLKDSKKVIGEKAVGALVDSLKAMSVKDGKLLTDTNGHKGLDLPTL